MIAEWSHVIMATIRIILSLSREEEKSQKDGEIYTVRYDAVNAMLLNEFLKEHQKVEDLKKDFQATVAQPHGAAQRASSANPESERPARRSESARGGREASKFATGRIRGGGPAPQMVNNP